MTKTFKTFEKKKGIYISPEQIIAISWTLISIALLAIEGYTNLSFNGWTKIIVFPWLIYLIGLMISTFFRYEKEFGEFVGELILDYNYIKLNGVKYNLNQIKSISFTLTDTRGKFTSHTFEFSPHLSNGIDNIISIELITGEKIETNFLQTDSNKLLPFKDELINYYSKGILNWLHLLDLLEITDYNEIQEFKKEITTIANNL